MPPKDDLPNSLQSSNANKEIHEQFYIDQTKNKLHFNKLEDTKEEIKEFKPTLVWPNIIIFLVIHLTAIYAIQCIFLAKLYTFIWGYFIALFGGFGITAGAHRLWTHRSYKAKWQFEALLLICYSIAGHNPIYEWVRDHRVHHKFSETDADPHNAKRGFFFAHVGWLLQKKHPEVIRKGKTIDMSDITNNKLIMFHQKHYIWFFLFFCFFLPSFVPIHFWNETYFNAILGMGFLRYCIFLNLTWLVNSAAHIWGDRPFDKTMNATDNAKVAWFTMGEGWHNYHHVFPWDYKAAELGGYMFNSATFWLGLFSKIGWAYDMKTPSKELIKKIAEKYGDGTYGLYHTHKEIDVNGNPVELIDDDVGPAYS